MPSSKFVKTCTGLLGLYFVGLGLTVAGFATDAWLDVGGVQTGLFRVCGFGSCVSMDIGQQPDWFLAVISLMIIGVIFTVIGGATYMFVPVSGGLQITGGLFTVCAVALFGAYNATDPSWQASWLGYSFALAAAGGVCTLVNGIVLLALLGTDGGGMTMEMILPGRGGKVGSV